MFSIRRFAIWLSASGELICIDETAYLGDLFRRGNNDPMSGLYHFHKIGGIELRPCSFCVESREATDEKLNIQQIFLQIHFIQGGYLRLFAA